MSVWENRRGSERQSLQGDMSSKSQFEKPKPHFGMHVSVVGGMGEGGHES